MRGARGYPVRVASAVERSISVMFGTAVIASVLLVTSSAPAQAGERDRSLGTATPFGDDLESEFSQGWRNGTEVLGLNDHMVPLDEFDSPYLDPVRWRVDTSVNGEVAVKNTSIEASIVAPSSFPNYSAALFRGKLSGDFDIVVPYDLTHWPDPDGGGGVLGVMWEPGGGGGSYLWEVGRAVLAGVNRYIGYDNGSIVAGDTTSATTGLLRLSRTGATLLGLYSEDAGGSWNLVLTNASMPTGQLRPIVAVGVVPGGNPPPFKVEFDFFFAQQSVLSEPFAAQGEPPVVDAVRLLPYNDNFDDGVLNPDRWAPALISGPAGATETGGKAQLFVTDSAAGDVMLPSRGILTGDYDVRVDFSLQSPATGNFWHALLRVGNQGGSAWQVLRTHDGALDCFSSSFGASCPTTQIESSFRAVRSGTTLSLFAGADSLTGWIPLGSGVVDSGPHRFSLGAVSSGADTPGINVVFDNLLVVESAGQSPAAYADATFESRVIDTGEDAPSNPKWGEIYFNTTTNYFVDASTVALYYFEDKGGQEARDESPQNFTMSFGTSATFVPGVRGDALRFDASGFPTIPPGLSCSVSPYWSYELWVRLEDVSVEQGLLEEIQAGQIGSLSVRTILGTGQVFVALRDQGSGLYDTLTSATGLAGGTWYHLAIVRDNVDLTFYINGTPDATRTVAPASGCPGIYTSVGYTGGFFLKGDIDELRMESRALSPGEIFQDYSARRYVRFQLASSDSPSGPWNFTGPDGTNRSWYSQPGQAAMLTDGHRYFRYRAELNSTNATQTPVTWDVAVTAEGPTIAEFGGAPLAAVAAAMGAAGAGWVSLRRRRGSRVASGGPGA
jgi:hypothetical protein